MNQITHRDSEHTRQGIAWVLSLSLFALSLLFYSESFASASMYVCRGANGKRHYTNVRTSSRCKPVAFRNSSRIYGSFSPTFSRMRSFTGRKGSNKYDGDIHTIATRYGVDPLLIKAIIHIESGFNHRAVSNKGAQGLMQLMPGTAQDLRVWNPFDPRQNIDGGTRYIRRMLKAFNGNLHLSLAAYNAGPNLVGRIGRIPAIPETMNYVRKVMGQYNYYKRHGKNSKKVQKKTGTLKIERAKTKKIYRS